MDLGIDVDVDSGIGMGSDMSSGQRHGLGKGLRHKHGIGDIEGCLYDLWWDHDIVGHLDDFWQEEFK